MGTVVWFQYKNTKSICPIFDQAKNKLVKNIHIHINFGGSDATNGSKDSEKRTEREIDLMLVPLWIQNPNGASENLPSNYLKGLDMRQ